ncbi:hypothetical protein ACSBL2_18845 [Pedobacter sp. AW31-3R]|uniref:hypothetical protein n=1 Tax=Pedobacter sp. AW31-3R TaxID=3445781 RepID=UPI003FA0643D
MKFLIIFFLGLTSSLSLTAQEVVSTLYSGTVNNRSVRMYLKQEPNPCGGETGFLYTGIYQYGKGKNWIELRIDENKKGNFCMTEFRFTGVMILKQSADTLEGIWISPDGRTQLKVFLKKQVLTGKQKAEMDDYIEQTHYSNNDC